VIYVQLTLFFAAQILIWSFAFSLGNALGYSEGLKLGEEIGRARRNEELRKAPNEDREDTEINADAH
jgi:hypothetical protein